MNLKVKMRIMMMVFVVLAWKLAPARAQQAQVLWGSRVGVPSRTSAPEYTALDSAFTFQVGAFFDNGVAGWTPTGENRSEWADHWLSADSAVYDETYRTFTGTCLVDPVFAGKQGYIWGFNNETSPGEWILMTNPDWVFPSGGSGLSFPQSWQTSGATVTIWGRVRNNPGATFHLRTWKMWNGLPPYVPGEQWLGMHFTAAQLADSVISAWGADPDRDGMTNLMEMALGALPWHANVEKMPEMGFMDLGGQFFLSLTVRRAPNVGVVYRAEVSSDLETWESGDVTVMSDEPSELVVRDNIPLVPGEKRFMRLRVDLDE